MKKILFMQFFFLLFASCKEQINNNRTVVNLNGTWEITSTRSMSVKPDTFIGTIPVPGLVDMTDADINHNYGVVYRGPQVPNEERQNDPADIYWENDLHLADQSEDSQGIFNTTIYWYRRTFILDEKAAESDVIELKINKARYHTWVYLNKQFVGDNVYCFTPGYFDLKPYINKNGIENELIIGVGSVNNLPDSVIMGNDFEKIKYIPGIYDDVKLTISGFPYITNIQTVPEIDQGNVRVVAELITDGQKGSADLSWVVKEVASGKTVTSGKVKHTSTDGEELTKVDFSIPIPDFKLWSPESPFLYELELTTSGDNANTRFGMRSFTTCPDSGVVKLNGKTYYMRGTNVTIFRFFEDVQRDNLPWDDQWVIRLHESFKNDMQWNSVRYCIGFPPDRWYEIADSIGLLIQDEYPVWTLTTPQDKNLHLGVGTDQLVREYTQWMRQRWNHPSVVIWDAQNEAIFPETGEAINLVRHLDLSNRPWDNGWSAPAGEKDIVEAHPYFLNRYRRPGYTIIDNILKDNLNQPRHPGGPRIRPADGGYYKNPVIINEYGWVWLTREGFPTLAAENIYAWFYSEADTPEKRFELYAKIVAMKTEYWRTHRQAAGVLWFGSLAFSRNEPPVTHTADCWLDVKNLVYYPFFLEYMKSAFSPVGLMIDLWDEQISAGSSLELKINMINDTYEKWSGNLKLTLKAGEKDYMMEELSVELDPLGKKIFTLPVHFPEIQGKAKLTAEINYNDEAVKSRREFVLQ